MLHNVEGRGSHLQLGHIDGCEPLCRLQSEKDTWSLRAGRCCSDEG